jgi:hypothetical protein
LKIANWIDEEGLAKMLERGWKERSRRAAPEEGRVIVKLGHPEKRVETFRSLPLEEADAA